MGFTPGPWYVSGEGLNALVRGDDATIVAVRHRHRRERNEANMRLIAAAPEMYEALVEAEAALDMGLRIVRGALRRHREGEGGR